MRMIGFMFISLAFLAGVTIGTVEIALINCVVFLAIALLAARYLAPRFGKNGIVYGMAGAFFASVLWPAPVMLMRDDAGCKGANCLPANTPATAQPAQPLAIVSQGFVP